jgi:hypothetical protein
MINQSLTPNEGLTEENIRYSHSSVPSIESRARRFQKKWNREPNRNPNFLDSPTRIRNRNREIKADGTGTGTVRTEIFL